MRRSFRIASLAATFALLSTGAPSAGTATPPGKQPPAATTPPAISGSPTQGQTLSATSGGWTGNSLSYAYQWLRCDLSGGACYAVSGEVAARHVASVADVGSTLRVRVTATNRNGTGSATSSATSVVAPAPSGSPGGSAPASTAPPVVSGTPASGHSLTTTAGSWSGGTMSYTYAWLRCDAAGANCAAIEGATSASYVLTSADVGSTIRSQVTATNSYGSASSRSAPSSSVSAQAPSGSRFGISDGASIVYEADATRQHELDLMRQANAGWTRFDFAWSAIEPTRGSFSFGYLDTAVAEAQARGIEVVAMLGYAPAWANGGHSDDKYAPVSASDYANFARAVAAHFGPRGVHVYELWNEPNISAFWKPTPDVAAYTALVRAAYPAIHAADPQSTVLAGAMAPHGAYHDTNCDGVADSGRDSTGYDPIDFLDAMYAGGAGGYFDALSHHPYERFIGLSYHPCSGWSQMQETPISLRSLMASHGDSGKQIWATEYGNDVPDWVDESTQASRLQQAMTAWSSYPWAGRFLEFNLWDSTGSGFGLLRSDGSQRPAYSVFQQLAAGS
jgi:Cellulase (glycosyl hydrolase family 5)